MNTKTITPDPKPKRAPRKTAANKATPAKDAADLFGSGQTIAQIALAIGKSHATVRELLTEAGTDFSADKNAVDIKDKVRTASAATLARRAANEADKAKVSESKAAERAERDEAKRDLVSQVVKRYEATGSVKEVAAMTTNASTGKPYSNTRIMRILAEAGVLTVTKRGDTSERDAAIVTAFEADSTIEQIATDYKLSAARVRSILKKGGKELAGGTRGGKLPEPGTPEWIEFSQDIATLTEKWGVALGTMAHAIRRSADVLAAKVA